MQFNMISSCLMWIVVIFDSSLGMLTLPDTFSDGNRVTESGSVKIVEFPGPDERFRRDVTHNFPDQLACELHCSGEPLRLALQRNRNIDVTRPVHVMRSGEIIRESVSMLKEVEYFQDAENGAALAVICEPKTGRKCDFRVEGIMANGEDLLLVYPKEEQQQQRQGRPHLDGEGEYIVEKISPAAINFSDYIVSDSVARSVPEDFRRVKRQASKTSYNVELMMVTDSSVYRFWHDLTTASTASERRSLTLSRITQYYAFVLNAVDLRYKNINETDLALNVLYSGLLIVENPLESDWTDGIATNNPADSNRSIVDSSQALSSFTTWVQSRSDLPQSDHVMLFTAYELSNDGKTSNAGLAFLKAICAQQSTSISENRFNFNGVTVAAHELGHSLGSVHDGDNNMCHPGDRFIMAPTSGPSTGSNAQNPWYFSSCSVAAFRDQIFQLDSDANNCLLTENSALDPTALTPHLQVLPGQEYSIDTQCAYYIGSGSTLCRTFYNETSYAGICGGIFCSLPGTSSCRLTVPARGTSCGTKKWCDNGACVYSADAPAVSASCPLGEQPGNISPAGLTCSQIAQFRGDLCYQEYYNQACCQSCLSIQTNITSCQFGDKSPSCTGLTPRDCYYNEELCCGTCADFKRPDLPGCEYGDKAPSCQKSYCTNPANADVCCETCYVAPTTQSTTTTSRTQPVTTVPTTTTSTTQPVTSLPATTTATTLPATSVTTVTTSTTPQVTTVPTTTTSTSEPVTAVPTMIASTTQPATRVLTTTTSTTQAVTTVPIATSTSQAVTTGPTTTTGTTQPVITVSTTESVTIAPTTTKSTTQAVTTVPTTTKSTTQAVTTVPTTTTSTTQAVTTVPTTTTSTTQAVTTVPTTTTSTTQAITATFTTTTSRTQPVTTAPTTTKSTTQAVTTVPTTTTSTTQAVTTVPTTTTSTTQAITATFTTTTSRTQPVTTAPTTTKSTTQAVTTVPTTTTSTTQAVTTVPTTTKSTTQAVTTVPTTTTSTTQAVTTMPTTTTSTTQAVTTVPTTTTSTTQAVTTVPTTTTSTTQAVTTVPTTTTSTTQAVTTVPTTTTSTTQAVTTVPTTTTSTTQAVTTVPTTTTSTTQAVTTMPTTKTSTTQAITAAFTTTTSRTQPVTTATTTTTTTTQAVTTMPTTTTSTTQPVTTLPTTPTTKPTTTVTNDETTKLTKLETTKALSRTSNIVATTTAEKATTMITHKTTETSGTPTVQTNEPQQPTASTIASPITTLTELSPTSMAHTPTLYDRTTTGTTKAFLTTTTTDVSSIADTTSPSVPNGTVTVSMTTDPVNLTNSPTVNTTDGAPPTSVWEEWAGIIAGMSAGFGLLVLAPSLACCLLKCRRQPKVPMDEISIKDKGHVEITPLSARSAYTDLKWQPGYGWIGQLGGSYAGSRTPYETLQKKQKRIKSNGIPETKTSKAEDGLFNSYTGPSLVPDIRQVQPGGFRNKAFVGDDSDISVTSGNPKTEGMHEVNERIFRNSGFSYNV